MKPNFNSFWRNRGAAVSPAGIEELTNGYGIIAAGSRWVTPKEEPVVLERAHHARWLADELNAYQPPYNNLSLPFVMLVNTAVDFTAGARSLVRERLRHILSNDTLCYRAPEVDLAARQDEVWGAILLAASGGLEGSLGVSDGFDLPRHSEALVAAIVERLMNLPDLELTAACSIAEQFGSVAIAAAIVGGALGREAGWYAGRLEEGWQRRRWGEVEEHAIADRPTRVAYDIAFDVIGQQRAD